jgi:hypothetical protein
MAHGQNAARNGHHREYWSRRPCPPDAGWGPVYKDITHRRERRESDRIVAKEVADL